MCCSIFAIFLSSYQMKNITYNRTIEYNLYFVIQHTTKFVLWIQPIPREQWAALTLTISNLYNILTAGKNVLCRQKGQISILI